MANTLKTGTTTGQRIAIWVILGFTIISTIALYVGSVLSQKNQLEDSAKAQEQLAAYQKATQEYQAKVDAQAKELSAKYYDTFKNYEKQPSAFNAASVKELATNDLVVGEGEEITADSTKFTAYYIGWKPDGVVFDSSFDSSSLKSPIVVEKQGDQWGVITGWSEGVQGMRIGGVRELTIPASKAYGETGSPNSTDTSKSIAPNTPLKFIVMLIPNDEVKQIEQPDYTKYFTE
jgi:FKBP-type peptidyl-prolyl cis-trans isomerase